MILQWLDLIGRIVSTFLLASIYTAIIFVIIYIVYRRSGKRLFKNFFVKGVLFFILIHLTIGITLFLYSFSYWEDTGMGEAPQLPIGYNQVIYCSDYENTYFFPDLNKTELNRDELHIENFIVKNNFLCAKLSHNYSNTPAYDYIVCNLSEKSDKIFANKVDYSIFARQNNLPLPEAFYDFKIHLKEYHANRPKWKKILLP